LIVTWNEQPPWFQRRAIEDVVVVLNAKVFKREVGTAKTVAKMLNRIKKIIMVVDSSY